MNLAQGIYLALLTIVGLINALPVLGVFDVSKLATAYGIQVSSPELEILLRHRALLFGVIGGAVIASIPYPLIRPAAMLMAGISMLGFLIIYGTTEHAGTALTRIAIIDVMGLLALAGAATLHVIR